MIRRSILSLCKFLEKTLVEMMDFVEVSEEAQIPRVWDVPPFMSYPRQGADGDEVWYQYRERERTGRRYILRVRLEEEDRRV